MWLLLLDFPRWHATCKRLGVPPAWESPRQRNDDASSAWEGGAFVKGSKGQWKMPP
jgi:hypothetical protein